MRPKMPAILTVTPESSPCSGDSLTTSTGTSRRAHGVVEDLGHRALLRTHPHDRPDYGDGESGPDEDGRDECLCRRAQLHGGDHGLPHLPSRPAGQHLVELLGRWFGHPAGSGRPVVAPAGPGRAEGVALVAEQVRRHFDAVQGQFVENLGAKTGGDEATHPFGGVDPVEDVLEQDGVALHALDLRDGVHDTGPAGRPLELHQESDCHDDLLSDGPLRQFDTAHHHHGFETAEQLARSVRVHRRHGSGVTGVHRLEHVESFGPAALTDDDAVWSHTKRVADQVADSYLAGPLGVGRPRLERDDMGSLDLKFRRLLDGDQTLAVGDEIREHVEHGRLAGAGATNHDHADLARARTPRGTPPNPS